MGGVWGGYAPLRSWKILQFWKSICAVWCILFWLSLGKIYPIYFRSIIRMMHIWMCVYNPQVRGEKNRNFIDLPPPNILPGWWTIQLPPSPQCWLKLSSHLAIVYALQAPSPNPNPSPRARSIPNSSASIISQYRHLTFPKCSFVGRIQFNWRSSQHIPSTSLITFCKLHIFAFNCQKFLFLVCIKPSTSLSLLYLLKYNPMLKRTLR